MTIVFKPRKIIHQDMRVEENTLAPLGIGSWRGQSMNRDVVYPTNA